MSWTKRQFIEQAFEELGVASYVFDLQAEQLQSALRRLDAMMGTWNAAGIRIGYPLPSSPESSVIEDETSVPDAANEAIYLNLALRLAPTIGKMVSPETMAAAKAAYATLSGRFATIPRRKYPGNMPRGAGYKSNDRPFTSNPTPTVDAGPDAELEFN